MRILLLPDKFKDALSATEVIDHITNGIQKVLPDSEIVSYCLADGGDGFLDAIKANNPDLILKSVTTVNARGRSINSNIGLDQTTKSAYIEMAQSSGIAQLNSSERNALFTSTLGTGIVIKKAIEMGYNTIYIGLGGSATNDGGCGIAVALGYKFIDSSGDYFIPTAENLIRIKEIQEETKIPKSIRIIAVNDVKNQLLGKKGATYVYGLQKGILSSDLNRVDNGMAHLNKIVKQQLGKDCSDIPGTGAAGGLGFGLKAFFNAEFIEGIDFFLKKTGLRSVLKEENFDLIITAEGKLDDQTIEGKLIMGISELGNSEKIPVVAFCGKNGLIEVSKEDLKLEDIIEISDPDKPLQYNLDNAANMLTKKAEEFMVHWTDKTN